MEHEPGTVLPYVTFGGFDQVMRVASDLAAPFFARWLEPEQASRAAEWAVRIVMAYCSDPSPYADLTEFAKDLGEDTLAELRGSVRKRLEAGARERSESLVREAVLEKLLPLLATRAEGSTEPMPTRARVILSNNSRVSRT